MTEKKKKKKKRRSFIDHLQRGTVHPQITPITTPEEPTSMLRSILSGDFKSIVIEGWEHEDDE
jgi:hypothetical protein